MAPRILIFGTGSIGAVYAWVFSNATSASNITAICRSNYDEASRNGFTIDSTVWGNDLKVKPTVARTVEEAVELAAGTPFDYIIICCKAIPTTPSTADLIKPAVTKGVTTIVLIQNGIGIEDQYAKAFPENPLLSTVVYLPATQTTPGTVHHKEIELLHIGTYPAAAPPHAKSAATAFTDLVAQAGGTAKLHDDVQSERWTKLLVNGSWNPICALSRCRDRQFIDSNAPGALGLVRDAMLEIAATARACGYSAVDEARVDFQIGRAAVRGLPGVQPSMMADALAGRNIEVEAIVGNCVRIAAERGVEVPVLRTIYFLACGLDFSFGLGGD